MEEYLQRAASDGPKNKAIESLNNYIDATKDYKSNYSAWENIGSFAKAVTQNASDPRAWEEFAIGAASAMIGMPVFGANTRNAWTGNNGKFGLSGGIIGEIIDANRDRKTFSPIHDYDIVIGPIADDGVVLQLTNFREGIYTPEQAAAQLQDRYLDQQYYFGTEQSLRFLHKTKVECL